MSWQALPQPVREIAEQELSPRQLQILKLHLGGRSTRQIALGLNLSPSTVSTHMFRIRQKLSTTKLETNDEEEAA